MIDSAKRSSAGRPDGRHYRACNLCEAICGIVVEHAVGGSGLEIRGDKDDPFSKGHLCPKALALGDVLNDPDRLTHPLRKTGDGYARVGWDEAFDEVARRLREVQARHGRDAVATYVGNPTVHNYGSLLFVPAFLKSLGTRNRFSATSVDQLPHHFSAYHMFGHQLLMPVPDVDRTDYFLVIGANPAVSNGSLMTAPGMRSRMKAIRDRGGTIVVIDPRRTRSAKLADRHHFIRPGTDALFLAAIVRTLFEEGLADLGRLADHSHGVASIERRVAGFTPERVAETTGIDAPAIRAIARELANARTAVCYGRIGTCVQRFGGLAQWLIVVVNALTGNLDRPGGAMFTHPAIDPVDRGTNRGSFGRWRSRVRKLPEFGGELPVAALVEEMTEPGPGQVRAFVTSAGNPVLSTPNGARLEAALESLEFMVSIDYYLNETTRHADIILPPTAALEHDHYDLVFNVFAVRDIARYSPTFVAPAEDTRHDWQILDALTERLGHQDMKSKMARAARRRLGPRGMVDLGLRFGRHGAGWNPFGRGLTLAKLEAAPHGLDLGALRPAFPERLKTRDRKIHLAPKPLIGDLERLEGAIGSPPETLTLISRRSVRSNNSWLHNSARLMRGADRCTVQVHPDDADRLGLDDEGRARIASRVGAIEARVEVTESIMPGVVCLPHGWGHDRNGTRLSVASRTPGASINDVTDDQAIDPLTGNAALSGVPVRVTPVEATLAETTPTEAAGVTAVDAMTSKLASA